MKDTAEDFYISLYNDCNETSKIFRFIPIFFTSKVSSILFYFIIIIIASLIEINFQCYLFGYITSFLIIAEHRRIILIRETVLNMCMIDEVYYDWEVKQNKDFLDQSGMNFKLSNSDRCSYFYERLNYVDCVNPITYIKRHHKFLSLVVALYIIIYLIFLIYSVI